MIAFVASVVMVVVVWLFIHNTTPGMAMRAVAQNKMATALAAGAGSLLAPIFLIYPAVGPVPCLKAFCVVIMGGMGSIKGAFLAASF